MALIIELQTASQAPSGAYFNPSRLSTKAWAKLNLFDLHGRLVSGRWRIPLRITPIKPHVTANDVNNMPQVSLNVLIYLCSTCIYLLII